MISEVDPCAISAPTAFVAAPEAKPKRKTAARAGKKLLHHDPETGLTLPEMFVGVARPSRILRATRYGTQVKELKNGRKETGVLHLCGTGSTEPEILFVSPCVLLEEIYSGHYGGQPQMLQGAPGNLFKRNLQRAGFRDADWRYTALVKYNVPRLKPTAADLHWSAPALDYEIKLYKPKIIVCLGKVPLDYLLGRKFKLRDVQGGFFRSEKYGCLIYPMDTLMSPLLKPEHLERFLTDLKEVRKALDETRGVAVAKIVTNYHVLKTADELANCLADIRSQNIRRMAVDGEWQGQTYVDGRLRSLQWAWKFGHAAYLRLMDDQLNYAFNVPMDTVAEILAPTFNDPGMSFIGHNGAADAVWMKHHLGIDVYQKFSFDTMFAQKCLNEYADLKLERLAVKYTDLGRYDLDLTIWKKDNKFGSEQEDTGYGRVPDKLLIPYALRDGDATLRVFPTLMQQLVEQGLWSYYWTILLPFVTDGFVELMETGIPINREFLADMRTVFTRNQTLLTKNFQKSIYGEACGKLVQWLAKINPAETPSLFRTLKTFHDDARAEGARLVANLRAEGKHVDEFPITRELPFRPYYEQALALFKDFVGESPTKIAEGVNFLNHWWEAPSFNINSTEHLRNWLFNVKKFVPIKTTKKDGVQTAWDRVLAFNDPIKQAEYTPAVDKNTLKVFAERDPLVGQIQELKSVTNIVKAFLGGAETEEDEKDPVTGKPKVQKGLAAWIQEDDRVHANFALTETDRPRCWKPNILNWPKAVAKPIEQGFRRVNKQLCREKYFELKAQGLTPQIIKAQVMPMIRVPVSLRACGQAPDGWAFIDMDLKTAEIVALAYNSGDKALLGVLYSPDTQFALMKKGDSEKPVRVAYNEITKASEDKWDTKVLVDKDHENLVRLADGALKHPKRDLHWEMAEGVKNDIRERLHKEIDRGIGKVGNFSIPYGATGGALERLIEANTGVRPKVGTGDAMIETYKNSYAVAYRFLMHMEQIVEDPGYYRAVTGAVRHFYYNNLLDVHGLRDWTKKSILSPLTRQARNYPMQHLVAATTAKALIQFIQGRREQGLSARVMMLLYDAMTAMAPLEELRPAATLLKSCLTTQTQWTIHGETFNFDVDVDYSFRWGTKPTKAEKEILKPYI